MRSTIGQMRQFSHFHVSRVPALPNFHVRIQPRRNFAENIVNNQTVSLLVHPNGRTKLYLVGTSHVSKLSAEEVQKVIKEVKPDTVLIELCDKRLRQLKATQGQVDDQDEDQFHKALHEMLPQAAEMVKNMVKNSGMQSGLFETMGKAVYRYLKQMGMHPGEEFRVAVREAEKIGAELVLGDRPVDETKRRMDEVFNMQNLMKLMRDQRAWSQFMSGNSFGDWDVIEALKDRENLRKINGTYKEIFPEIYERLVTERDEYLANSLENCANGGSRVMVGVVGIGHMDGIEAIWRKARKKTYVLPDGSEVVM